MNNKEFCKWVDNRFKSEKHKQRGPFGSYNHLVRLGSDTMYFFSSGDTESQAWKEAKDEIMSKAEYYFKLKYPNAKLVQVIDASKKPEKEVYGIEVENEGFEDNLVVFQKTKTDIWKNALKAAFKLKCHV